MNLLMFYLFAAMIVFFSVLTVTSRRILRSAVYLLFVLLATAGLYFWLNYYFLAAIQISLYAGGIVVLIVFSILLTSQIDHKFDKVKIPAMLMGILAAGGGLLMSILTIINTVFTPSEQTVAVASVKEIGRRFLGMERNGYILPFEVITVLLLAALIAAVVVAKKRNTK